MTARKKAPSLNLVDLQESQFASLYTGTIEPILRGKEGPRIEAVRTFWKRAALGGLGTGTLLKVEVGQALVMATEGQELTDPDTGASLGKEEGKTIGKLKVTKALEKVSYCEVTEGEKSPEAGTVVTFDKK